MSATEIGENTANILNLLFFTINLHFVTSNQIPIYWKPNLPLTSSIYLVFLPLEMQGRLKQTKVYCSCFYFVWKERTHKALSGSSKNPFLQFVCYWYNFLRWRFFVLWYNWEVLLLIIVYHYSEIVLSAILLLSLNPVFWKKSIYYALSPQ